MWSWHTCSSWNRHQGTLTAQARGPRRTVQCTSVQQSPLLYRCTVRGADYEVVQLCSVILVIRQWTLQCRSVRPVHLWPCETSDIVTTQTSRHQSAQVRMWGPRHAWCRDHMWGRGEDWGHDISGARARPSQDQSRPSVWVCVCE